MLWSPLELSIRPCASWGAPTKHTCYSGGTVSLPVIGHAVITFKTYLRILGKLPSAARPIFFFQFNPILTRIYKRVQIVDEPWDNQIKIPWLSPTLGAKIVPWLSRKNYLFPKFPRFSLMVGTLHLLGLLVLLEKVSALVTKRPEVVSWEFHWVCLS